jgi:protein involved in polysaccharide export with SLBB domain
MVAKGTSAASHRHAVGAAVASVSGSVVTPGSSSVLAGDGVIGDALEAAEGTTPAIGDAFVAAEGTTPAAS